MSPPDQVPDVEVPAKARPRTYSASYKARILEEYDALGKAGKGALLRREGLYSSLIAAWRKQRDDGVRAALASRPVGRRPMPGIGSWHGCGRGSPGWRASWTPPGR